MGTGQQQFCVRWNSYQSNLQNAFPKLLTSEHFVDVTLACESEMIKCHKVVLSACSTYFEKLLVQNPCQHPIIFMKDMRFIEMQALVDFMYKGEVNVTQDELPSLLKSAEALQIRGLCGSDQLLSQHHLGNIQTQVNNAVNAAVAAAASACNAAANEASNNKVAVQASSTPMHPNQITSNDVKRKTNSSVGGDAAEESVKTPSAVSSSAAPSESDDTESSSLHHVKDEHDQFKEEMLEGDESYYEGDSEIMDSEYLEDEEHGHGGALLQDGSKAPEFAIANVSCQYEGGSGGSRRIRRSDAELRRAADCITRGQTFQTVSDQFNIPISTIRFYMARKGILPRRKRGRACSTSSPQGISMSPSPGQYHPPGNTSPIGPPYHIVHYKLPALGAKLK